MNVDRHEFEMGLYELLGLKALASNPDAGSASGVGNFWLDTSGRLHFKFVNGTDVLIQTSGASAGFAPVTVLTTAALPTNTYSATTQQMTMSATGIVTVNGVALAVGMRVGAFGENNSNVGIYDVITAGAVGVALVLQRSADANSSSAWALGKVVSVSAQDTVNGSELFYVSNSSAITLDTTIITCVPVRAPSPFTARAATLAALAANTYANGNGGIGATLTANGNGAIAAQDGVTLLAGDRLLVLFEATAANNGVYIVTQVGTGGTPYILTRAPDACTPAQLAGAEIVVTKGAVNSGSTWFLPLDAPNITVGTTALSFLRVAAGLIHQVITYSATPAFTQAESQQVTMTGNITGWTLPAGVGDMEVAISFIQDGTGSRTLAGAGANIRLAGALTLSTGAGKIDTITLKWNANLGTPAWVEKSRALNA
jgi:hypothetical protein